MELTQLIQFKTIAETGSMRIAAEQLYITQPALSHSLSRLEEEFGCPLFERSKQRLILNECGKTVLAYTRKILMDVEMMKMSANRRQVEEVRICSEDATCLPFLCNILSEKFQEIKFVHHVTEENRALRLIEEGNADIFICNHVIRTPSFFTTYICTDQVYISLREDDPIAKNESFMMGDLKDRSIVYTNEKGYLIPEILRSLKENGIRPKKLEAYPFAQFLLRIIDTEDLHFVSDITFNAALEKGRVLLPIVNPSVEMNYYATCKEGKAELYLPFFTALQRRFWK